MINLLHLTRSLSWQAVSIMVLVVLQVACASKVPLTEPAPVEDKQAQTAVSRQHTPELAGRTNPVGTPDVSSMRQVTTVNTQSDSLVANGGTVYFDFDSSSIKPEFQGLIEMQAKRLTANRSLKATLAGHTDEIGGREYNLALGQKRAEAVKRALSILGAQESQIEAVSFGKEKPAVAGSNDAANAKNRRVDIRSETAVR